MRVPLSPLPQLLPRLDEGLDSSWAGKPVVYEAAILEGTFVELAYTVGAEVRQGVAELLDPPFTQHMRFFGTGSACHDGAILTNFAFCSLSPIAEVAKHL